MFKKDFIFGCATAAFQIEGAHDKDGKCPSIWDKFCEDKTHIFDASDGSQACQSYDRYLEDVKLIEELGVDSYRFSISWPRVINDNNEMNKAGLDYYRNLAIELKKRNIEPCVTLYHWDMPQSIHEKGGFLNDEFPKWFEHYTDVVTSYLGDVVKTWITFNEPQVLLNHGYNTGIYAPGLHITDKEMLVCIHNLLKAHGLSVKMIRKNVENSSVGIAPCGLAVIPARENDEKLLNSCKEFYFSIREMIATSISIYSDPIYLGDYPKEYYEKFKDILPNITKEDLELIHQPLDIMYQNVYSGGFYDYDENGKLVRLRDKLGCPMGDISWLKVVPESVYYVPKFLYERYKTPIIISENGDCCHDSISLDGKVHDPNRIDFIRRYLLNLEKASKEVDVRGYYYWSLLDNFEWALGYSKRFGLVFVDYATYERIPKDSFYEYKKIIGEKNKN